MDMRMQIFRTDDVGGFLSCPFCGSTSQRVVQSKTSFGDIVQETVAICCDGCGLEFPATFEVKRPLKNTVMEMARDHIDDIRGQWNRRQEKEVTHD